MTVHTNQKKVAIVTGSSSGIGLETVLTLAQNGFITYASMRNPDKAPDILKDAKRKMNLPIELVQLDVSDDNSTQQAISFIAKKEGQINLLVNNAGYTQLGAIEDLTLEEVASQFNTNVFGAFRTIKEVVPIMRRQQKPKQQQQQLQQSQSTTAGGGAGTIINIGSANGFFGVPCASAYVATKFALEGVTQSLRYELAPFGIKVSIIEPGAIKTGVATRNMFIPKKIREQPQLATLEQEENLKNNNMPIISSFFRRNNKDHYR